MLKEKIFDKNPCWFMRESFAGKDSGFPALQHYRLLKITIFMKFIPPRHLMTT